MLSVTLMLPVGLMLSAATINNKKPNILFCISDDQSWLHAGAMGDPVVKTPAFDRVAREGILFTNAYCDAPSCAPSRGAILTGQHIWRLGKGGNLHSTLPAEFATYPALLRDNGYFVGYTGKGWAPGNLRAGGRTENPAGPRFVGKRLRKKPFRFATNVDYAGNFETFLNKKPNDTPFCFWLGTYESHRAYEEGSGRRAGKDPKKVIVPPCLPDHPIVRSDMLDYFMEVEHFDKMVARAIASLEKRGLLENTIVVVTSDNGMPFPRAKATLYDYGTHMPLAIRWPKGIKNPGRKYDGFVNLSDMAPTFLEAAGLTPPTIMTSHSLMDIFSQNEKTLRDAAFTAMERHDGCRKGGKGYPCRAMRTKDFLYIRNYKPDRWPAGNPDAKYCARAIPFGEVDSAPSKTLLLDNKDKYAKYYGLAFGKRPAEELYDVRSDPGQINNVAAEPEYEKTRNRLAARLQEYTAHTGDPRALGDEAPWDYYPYYGGRKNKDWKVDTKE